MYGLDPQTQRRARIRMVALFLGSATVAVAVAAIVPGHGLPRPIWLWIVLTLTYVYLEWNGVEVNDRLVASSASMVVITAAVIFGQGGAVLGGAAMAALSPLTPRDIREKRVFQPLVNMGQATLAVTGGTVAMVILLPEVIQPGNLWRVAAASIIAAVVHGSLNYRFVLFIVKQVWGRKEVRPWSKLSTILPQLDWQRVPRGVARCGLRLARRR